MGALNASIKGSMGEEFEKRKKKDEEAHKLVNQGQVDEAIKLFRENLQWSLKNLGQNHEATIYDQETLAFYLNETKKFDEAKQLDELSVKTRADVEGISPPSVEYLETERNLANDYFGLRNFKEAAEIYERNYEARKIHSKLGKEHKETLAVAHDLASCWHRMKLYDKSKALNKQILASREARPDQNRWFTQRDVCLSREAIGLNELESGKPDQAMKLFQTNINFLESAECTFSKESGLKRSYMAANKRGLYRCEKYIKQRNKQEAAATKAAAEKKAAVEEEIKRKEAEKNELLNASRTQEIADRYAKQAAEKKEAERLQREKSDKENERIVNEISETEVARNRRDRTFIPPRGTPPTGNTSKGEPMIPSFQVAPLIPVPRIAGAGSESGFDKPKTTAPEWHRRSWQHGSDSNTSPQRRRANSQDSRPLSQRIEFNYMPSSEALSRIREPHHIPKPENNNTMQGLTLPSGSWKDNSNKYVKPDSNNVESMTIQAGGLHPGKAAAAIGRSNSVNTRREKVPVVLRPRSASPTPPVRCESFHYQQLFDAQEGSSDPVSTRAVDSWLYSLRRETQKLLTSGIGRKKDCQRVKIAILDTGVDLSHPDFKKDQEGKWEDKRIKKPEDFLNPGGNGYDICGHGTHCVGLLRTIAPWADIYVARVAKDFESDLDPEVVAKAITRASCSGKDAAGVKNWNVDIITMSFGFYSRSSVVEKAIYLALSRPILVFAAASNNGSRRDVTFPAWMRGVICVNSANADGKPSTFNPDFDAARAFTILGENVKSTWTTHVKEESASEPVTHKVMSGTSVATPIAAGVAALVLEYTIQNDPESWILDCLDDLKQYDGIATVFDTMAKKSLEGYKNIVPWNLLKAEYGRNLITNNLQLQLWRYKPPEPN